MEKDGKLKSKLTEFDNGSSVRVYWNSDYEGSPKHSMNKEIEK